MHVTRAAAACAVLLVASATACGSDAAESCETVPGTGGIVACGTTEPLPPIDPQSQASAYVNLTPVQQASPESVPYVTGKMVIVDKAETGEGRQLNPGSFNAGIPWQIEQDGQGELMAAVAVTSPGSSLAHVERPEEVGTVVWMSCVENATDTYSNGATGYTTNCTAKVIDKAKNAIVGEESASFAPPNSTSCSATQSECDRYGSIDDVHFARWLEGLPRTPLGVVATAPAESPSPAGSG